ncbi:MAG: CARDB domain-containing protein [Candidatus Gracilibacteria bacterium]|jgi:hypothetical protein
MKRTKILIGFLSLAVIAGAVLVAPSLIQGKFPHPIKMLSKPDLTIADISVDDDYKLNINQANIGEKDASGTGYTHVYIDGTLIWTYSWSALSDTNFLVAGGSSILQPQAIEGVSTIKACIDAKENIVEKDETNNCLEVEVGPEVSIQYLSMDPDPAKVGEAVEIRFSVQNQESAPAPAGQVTLGFEINGVAFAEQTFEIGEISSPGAYSSIVLDVDSLPSAGSYISPTGTEYTHMLDWTKVEFSYGTTALSSDYGVYFNAE